MVQCKMDFVFARGEVLVDGAAKGDRASLFCKVSTRSCTSGKIDAELDPLEPERDLARDHLVGSGREHSVHNLFWVFSGEFTHCPRFGREPRFRSEFATMTFFVAALPFSLPFTFFLEGNIC